MKDHLDTRLAPEAMTQMSETLGLNLAGEMNANALSKRQLHRAAERCETCANAEGCARWLEAHEDGAKAAPNLCANKTLWDHLAEGR